jgi:DNA polymerase-3 subunit delta'
VSARPDGLLPTVRSRCPQLRFGRLDVDDVTALLVERQKLSAVAAREIAFAADGSPGRAFADASALGESVRALAERVISLAEASPAERLRVAASLAEPDKKAKRAPGTKAASDRDMLRERLDALGVIVRDLGIEASGGDRRWQSRPPDARLADLARRLGPVRLAHAYAAVEEARQALDRNVSFKTVADWVALEL